jgi:hypothetical protein
MRIFVLAATYELRVSRKSHLRDHHRLRVLLKKGVGEVCDNPSPFINPYFPYDLCYNV